jgi:hypothetical protein
MVKTRLQSFTILLCLLSVAALVTLWVRGCLAKDELDLRCSPFRLSVTSYPHHLQIVYTADGYLPDPLIGIATGWPAIPKRSAYLELRFEREPHHWSLWLPHWLPVLLLMILPLHALLMHRRHVRRQQRGLCNQCGYDLRASGDRCPECGTGRDEAFTVVRTP